MEDAFFAAPDAAPAGAKIVCKAFGAPRAEVARLLRDAAETMERQPEAFDDRLDEFTVEAGPAVSVEPIADEPWWRRAVWRARLGAADVLERLAKRASRAAEG